MTIQERKLRCPLPPNGSRNRYYFTLKSNKQKSVAIPREAIDELKKLDSKGKHIKNFFAYSAQGKKVLIK